MSVSIANGIATFTGTGALTGAAAQLGGATSAVIVGYTSLGSKAFMGASGLTSITIPSSVTTIGPEGLHSTGLRSIELPSSVTSIDDAAFFGSSLTSIIIPSSVNSIAGNAFSYSGLTSATFPNSATVIARGLTVTTSPQYFFGKNGVTIIVSDTKVFTGTGTLTNATSQLDGKAIVRIDGYSSIDANAFQDASGLTFITIPSSVTSIGENAFQGSGLTNATFPTRASVVAFGLTITNSTQTLFGKSNVLVTALDTKIFNGSGDLTGATAQLSGATHAIIQGYTSIGTSAFIGAGITSIDIQSAVTSIGADVFQWTALKSITFPSSVTSIGDRCFTNSGSLTSITILSYVFSIGFAAFQNTGLTTATLPTSALAAALGLTVTSSTQSFFYKSGVTVIVADTKIFTGTGSLTNATSQLSGKAIVVIEGYSSIDANAFQDAVGVTSVTIPASVTSIGADAFLGSGLTTATFQTRDSVVALGLTITLSTQTFFGKSNVLVTALGTKIFNGSGDLTGATAQLSGATHAIIQGYTSIGNSAFYGGGITSIDIGSSVTSIGADVFQWTGLKSITFPSSVTSIGDRCFTNSGSLTSITILSYVFSIGFAAFQNTGLTTATLPTSALAASLGLIATSSPQTFFYKNGVTVIVADVKIFSGTGPLTNATSQLNGKTNVRIEGYSSIGANAFQDASGVTSVTIPASVTSIGENAFQGSGLTTATFAVRTYFSTFGLALTLSPQSFFGKSSVIVTSNDTKIFSGTGPLNDGNGQLGGATNAIIQGYSSIGTNAFRLASGLTSVTISSSVTAIGNGSFSDTYPLRSVVIEIPSSLASIGDGAFYSSGLTSITIPSTVTSIVSNAFTNSGLTTATFQTSASVVARGLAVTSSPQSFFGKTGVTVIADDTKVFIGTGPLTNATLQLNGKTSVIIEGYSSIDANAFQDASGVTSVTIPSSVTSIGASAFQGSGLTSVTIPSSVTSIGENAFQGSGLTNATFAVRTYFSTFGLALTLSPQSLFGKSNVLVTALDTKIFNGSGTLTGATAQLSGAKHAIIQGYTSIGGNAFQNASGLTSIDIQSVVNSIGNDAFSGTGLKSMTFPSSVTSIGDRSFQNSSGLTSINVLSSVAYIGLNAFQSTGLTTATFPTSTSIVARGLTLTSSPQSFFGKTDVTVIADDTKVFTGTGPLTNATSQLSGKMNVRIEGYSSIDANAFQDASGLTSVTIPSSVTSIGANAFQGSGLTNVTFPTRDSVVALGLTITSSTQTFFGKSNILVTALDTKIFNGSGTLTGATAQLSGAKHAIIQGYTSIGGNAFQNASGLTSIDIQSVVNSIGNDAFSGTGLKSMTFPSSVTSIGDRSFQNSSGLTSITILSSVFSIGLNAFQNTALTTATFPNSASIVARGLTLTSSPQSFFGKSNVTVIADDTKVFTGTGTLTNATSQLSGKTSVLIEGYSSIGASAFQDASGVTSITIPSSVTSIGENAFQGSGLTTARFAVGTYFSTFGLTFTDSVQSFFGKSDVLVIALNTKVFNGSGSLTGATSQLSGATHAIIQGYTSIGNNAFTSAGITSIDIASSVTSIGHDAFTWTALKSITFPSSVTSIGDRCFQNSSGLTSITINSSVFSIGGGGAFSNTGLTTATFSTRTSVIALGLTSTASTQSFFGKNGVTVIASDTKIFTGTGSLTNATSQLSGKAIVVIEGYSSIGANAFQDASGVTSVIIPSSVTSIVSNAFTNSGLTSATFPTRASVVAFGFTITLSTQTFFGKSNVLVTASDTKIFNGSGSLTGATAQLSGATHAIIQGYTSIGDSAFYGAGITSIDIQSAVTSIGVSAFWGSGLKSIIIPSSVTRLNDYVFNYSGGLTSVTIPASVTGIGSGIFANTVLTTAIFVKSSNLSVFNVSVGSGQGISGRSNVTVSIITKVFNGSGALTNATSNLQGATNAEITGYSSIGANAFQTASGLTSVTISASVTSIGTDAFLSSGLTSATFAVSTYFSTFGLTLTDSPQSFFGKTNVVVTTLDTKVFDGSGELTGATAQLGGATNVIIKGYSSIGQNAFQNATGLKSITIPSSVNKIGISALSGTGLTSLLIPASVTILGQAFVWATNNLKTITFEPNSLVTNIGYQVFKNATGLTSISLPTGVTMIDSEAFSSTSSLTSITIPSSVTSIDSTAFTSSALTTATFPTSSSFASLGLTNTASTQSFFGTTGVTVVSLDTKIFSGTGPLTNATSQLNGATSVIIVGYSTISSYAFNDAQQITSVSIPSSVTSIEVNAFIYTSNMSSFIVDSSNNNYSSDSSGVLFNKNKTSIVLYPIGNSRTAYTIPNTVTRVENYAFFNSNKLQSLTMPVGLVSIGANTFESLPNLTSVAIPYTVTSIGNAAFYSCNKITSVTFPLGVDGSVSRLTSIGNNVFGNTSILQSITIPSAVTSIGSSAFQSSGLTSVTIPSAVTSIGSNAFLSSGVTSATFAVSTYFSTFGLTITDSPQLFFGKSNVVITTLDTKVFNGSDELTNATSQLNGATNVIIQGYSSIGNNAFKDAIGVTYIIIPSSVTSIGASAFQGMTGLTSVTIPSLVTSIGASAFQGMTGLTSVTIPSLVTSIEASVFQGATGLTSVTIPSSVTSIGASAFQGATGLTSVTIPSSVTSIGESAFQGATGLTSVTIPSSVGSIGTSVFQDATGLTSVTIPSSVTSIGSSAFQGAIGLTSVTIPSSVTSIGGSAFTSSGLTTATFSTRTSIIALGLTSTASTQSFFGKTGVTVIALDTKIFSGTGPLTNAASQLNGKAIVRIEGHSSIGANAFQDASGITSITIQSTVTSIGDSAFQSATGLTLITLPSSIDSIGASAFQGATGLTYVTIPSAVTIIGASAFRSASNITTFYVDANNNNYSSDNNGALFNKDKTILIQYPLGNTSTLYTIPNTVASIGVSAFQGATGLQGVTVPSSVTSIASTAFVSSGITSAVFEESILLDALSPSIIPGSGKTLYGKSGINVSWLTKVFNGSGSLTGATALLYGATSVRIATYSSIGEDAFRDSNGVTSVTISSSVTSIGASAFRDVIGLSSITIPSSVTSIGASAFQGVTGLSSITIPSSVISIESDAFLFSSLTSITIPSSVTSIGLSAFQDMSNLPEIMVDPANTYYSSDNGVLFNKDKTILVQYPNGNPRTLYNIPDSVSEIGNSAFVRATSLTSITIPSSVSILQDYSFLGMTGITSITIPSSVISIGNYTFLGMTGITSINIPSSVTSIASTAFVSSGLTSAVFAESILLDGLGITPGTNTLYGASEVNVSWITKVFNESGALTDAAGSLYGATNVRIETHSSIGAYAFNGASTVTSITIPSSVTSIGDWALANATALTSLSIPSSVTSIGDNSFYNTTSLLQFTVDVSNNTYKSDTYGVLFNKTQKTIIQYPAGSASTSYEIPSSVTSLGIYAFQGASALTSIILPASATSIGATAFEDSGLTTALVESALYVDDIGLSAGDLITGYSVPLFFGKASVTVRYNEAKRVFIQAAPTAIISDNTFISLLTSLAVNISNITSEIVPLTNDPYVEYSATLTIPNGNLSTLSEVNKANIIDNVKALYAAQLGVSLSKVIVTLSSGSIIVNVDILKDGITETVVPICFPKGTPVTTNQGVIAIEQLNPDIHTIRGKKIVAITQTRPLHKYIISIETDALGKNVPSAPIQISKEHKVFYKGKMVKANELVEVCEGVTRIPYNGETLYNVLMEKHDNMMINNVICETLDPKNIMAKICGGKYNRVEQANICKELNDIIKTDNVPAYKKLYASLK